VTYSPFQVGDLHIEAWLDAEMRGAGEYAEVNIPVELQNEADQIMTTFALTSGETPEVVILAGE